MSYSGYAHLDAAGLVPQAELPAELVYLVGGLLPSGLIPDQEITLQKIQNISTDKVLGRQSPGPGVVEEIDCTAAGRAILAALDAAAQRAALGLGTIATQNAEDVEITGGGISGVTFTGNLGGVLECGGYGINDAGGLLVQSGGTVGTMPSAGQVFFVSAWDVDGGFYKNFITLISGNTPSCDLDTSVTINGGYIYRAGGTDVPVADGGTGASSASAARNNLGIFDGQFSPTITPVTNVASATIQDMTWGRVGNSIFFSCRGSIDVTSASVATEVGITIPVASNFTLFTELAGVAYSADQAALGASLRADITNDRIALRYVAGAGTSSYEFTITGSYRVI